jgi:hypothetical protein
MSLHNHVCSHCGTELVCCCAVSLQFDRLTGKPREFSCIPCMILAENIIQDALLEHWERAKAEVPS